METILQLILIFTLLTGGAAAAAVLREIVVKPEPLFATSTVPFPKPDWADLSLHPDLKCGSENTMKRYVVYGDKGQAGMGNVLIYWPAVYAFALIQNREIILTEGTLAAYICETQPNCIYRTMKEIPKNETSFWNHPHHSHDMFTTTARELYQFAANEIKLDNKVMISKGFLDKSQWYIINTNTSRCITKLTGCPMWDSNCVIKHAFASLYPMPFASHLLEHSRLSGDEVRINAAFDSKTSIGDYFTDRSSGGGNPFFSRRFDLGIHLRIQFHLFENHTDPNAPEFIKLQQNYIKEKMSVAIMNQTVTWIKNNLADGSAIFVAADDEYVKQTLASKIEDAGYSVTLSNSKGIKHSKHIHLGGNNWKHMEHVDSNIFYAIFDWFTLATAKRIYAYRSVPAGQCQQRASSFALSAQHFSRSPNATLLCDPMEPSNTFKIWKPFPP